ncbi:MAG: hypothetical protein ACQEUT_18095 [Bacillota bacterium]
MNQVIAILEERMRLATFSLQRKQEEYDTKFIPFYNDVVKDKELLEQQLEVAQEEVTEIKNAITQLGGTV